MVSELPGYRNLGYSFENDTTSTIAWLESASYSSPVYWAMPPRKGVTGPMSATCCFVVCFMGRAASLREECPL